MPLVSIREVRSWQKMRHPIFSARGTVMLAAGTPLTVSLMSRLTGLNFQWLEVCDREMPDEGLNPALPNELRGQALQVLRGAFRAVGSAYRLNRRELERNRLPSISPDYVRERLLRRRRRDRLAHDLLGPNIVEVSYRIGDAAIAADAAGTLPFGSNRSPRTFLAAHCLDVALTSGMLARDFHYERDEVARIVLGALFHDVGHVLFPEGWFFGSGPDEDAAPPSAQVLARAHRLHPVLGYLILKEQRVTDLLTAHVAYQHHEHQDGSGFPRGLKGPNRVLSREQALHTSPMLIHRYANIVAVANTYDRLISTPPGGFGLPPQEAARRLRALAGTHLNRAAVSGLLAAVPPFPVASDVWVTGGEYDGFQGIVVQVRRRRMNQPVVRLTFNREGKRIQPVEIDTASEPMRLSVEPPAGGGLSDVAGPPSVASRPRHRRGSGQGREA